MIINPDEKNWRDKFLIRSWDGGEMKYPYKAIRSSTGIYIDYQGLIEKNRDITISPKIELKLATDEFYDLEKDPYQLDNKIDCTEPICLKKIEQHQSWLSDLENCKDGTCQLFEDIQTKDS